MDSRQSVWLVPLDGSEASKQALKWTLDTLYSKGDEVHVVHVIESLPGELAADFCILGPNTDAHRQKVIDAKALMLGACKPLSQADTPFTMHIAEYRTDTASIGAAISALAEQLDATGVVLAKHNKGFIKEAFLGSVAKACARQCKKPVILLRA